MINTLDEENFIDVICQHTKKGLIIPLRLRFQDEDGLFHDYTVKAYKEISHPNPFLTPYGTISHSHTWTFDCKITVFGSYKLIRVFYNAMDNLWRIIFIK